MLTAILRRARTHSLFALFALGLLALAPAMAQATTSQTFTGCGSFSTTAPANAISAGVTVKGSSGGYSGYGGSPGSGATVSFTTPVSGSQPLYGSVGCQPGSAGYDSDGGNGYTGSNGGGGSGGYGFNDGGTGGNASWLGYQPATYDAYGIAGGGGGAGAQGQWYNGGGSAGVGGQGGNANANGGNGGTEYDYSESAGGGSGGYSGANGGGGNYGRSNGCSANNTGGGCGGGGYYEYYCDFGCYYEGSGGGGGGGGGYVGGGGGGGGYTDSDYYGGGGGGGGGGSSAVLNGATSTGQGTNSGNGSVSVTYTIGAVASVSPGTQSFGSVTTGSSQSETFTLTNTSADTPLNTIGLSAGGAYSIPAGQNSCAGQTLAVNGGSCTFVVTFSPTTDGSQGGDLSVSSSATNGTQTVDIAGTGEYPPAVSVQSAQDFGTVTTSQTQDETVTVTNTGDETLNPSQVTIGGANPDQFSIVAGNDTCSNGTVAGDGGTCTIELAFSPSSDGAKSATLILPSNDANSPASVTLTGTGSNLPAASVESAQDFGTVTTGQTQHETITVTDAGDQTLNVGQATVGGTNPGRFAIGTDTCSTQSVDAGGTCTIDVAFAPTTDGAKQATLSIPSNDVASPATVTLTGTGSNSPALGVESAQGFGTVTDGQSQSQTITVTDTGDQDLNVGQATIAGADAPDFTLAQDTCSTVTLHASGTCAVTVQFAPSTRQAETAVLSMPSNDAASPATVMLTGTGSKSADVSATPASLAFGTVMTGQSHVMTVTVTNTGDQALNVGQATISGAGAAPFSLASGQDSCPAQTVTAGDSCTIAVQFAPTGAGNATATLTVPSNASSGSVTAALTGAGQSPAPASQAPTLTVPTVAAAGLTVQEGPGAAPTGLTVQMSAPGTLTVTIEQNINGTWVTAGTQTVSAQQAGALHIPLSATASGRTLTPGHYRIVLQASANGQTGTPVTMPLTVKPPANGPHGQPRLLSVTVNPQAVTWQRAHSAPTLWLTFLLSRAAKLQMTLQAQTGGHWQQVAGTTTHVLAGSDRVQLVGRWRGRLVPARVVRLTMTASAAGQRSVAETFYITVHHAPGWAKDMTRAFLSAP